MINLRCHATRDILRLQLKCWLSFIRAWIFGGTYYTPKLVPNPLLSLPRNMTCPLCASGRKFKRCCVNTLPRQVLPAVEAEARALMKAGRLS